MYADPVHWFFRSFMLACVCTDRQNNRTGRESFMSTSMSIVVAIQKQLMDQTPLFHERDSESESLSRVVECTTKELGQRKNAAPSILRNTCYRSQQEYFSLMEMLKWMKQREAVRS